MGRSLFAIATGFVLIAALTLGTDLALHAAVPSLYDASGATQSAPVLLLMMAYVALYAVGGCYLCARLAPSHPRVHTALLGVLGLAATTWASLQQRELRPAWFHVVSILLVMVYAMLGGQLRVMELEQRPSHRLGAARAA
jgi:drug/metabolite transporter (DMT)-like permease